MKSFVFNRIKVALHIQFPDVGILTQIILTNGIDKKVLFIIKHPDFGPLLGQLYPKGISLG